MSLVFFANLTRVLLAPALLMAVAQMAGAAILIEHDTATGFTSTGYYNDKIGTILDGTDPFFPCADVACGDPTISLNAPPNISAASGILGNWLGNPGTLNSNWMLQSIPTSWPVNTETAIVYPFNAATALTNVHLLAGVDNGILVWLDGQFVLGEEAPGGFSEWEYSKSLPNLSAGQHYLQVLREDHGGGDGFVIQLSASPTSVPEPMTLALFGVGLAGLCLIRRS